MEKLIKILPFALSFLLVMGCGRKAVPVASTTTITQKADSSHVATTNVRTDSSYVETVIEKKLAGSQAGISLTKNQLDSLILSMRAMPQGLREVYRTDPTLQTTIKIMMDSIGRLHFICTTAERTYWEKTISQQKLIESLTTELTKKNHLLNEATEIIKENQRTWWDDVKGFFKTIRGLLVIIALIVIVATVVGVLNKFRPKAP